MFLLLHTLSCACRCCRFLDLSIFIASVLESRLCRRSWPSRPFDFCGIAAWPAWHYLLLVWLAPWWSAVCCAAFSHIGSLLCTMRYAI